MHFIKNPRIDSDAYAPFGGGDLHKIVKNLLLSAWRFTQTADMFYGQFQTREFNFAQ